MDRELDYQLLFEQGAGAVVVLAVEGEVLAANREALRITRRSLVHLKRAERDGLFDVSDARLGPAFEELRSTGWFEGELCMLRWNEAPFPVEVAMAGFGDGLVNVHFRDLTGHEQAVEVRRLREKLEATAAKLEESERRLRESEERFRLTFEEAAVGIAHVAPEGRWLGVNGKLCEIVGYSREELLRLTFQDITHRDDLDADLRQLRLVLSGEINEYSMEKRYVKKCGSVVWVDLKVSLVRDDGGEPSYFVSVISDITDRKLSQEALRSLTAREVEVLRLMAQGLRNRNIAQRMDLSEGTVKNHVHHIFEKLDVHSRSEAVSRAFDLGLAW